MSDAALPSIFAGRPSREFTDASPTEVRKLRGSKAAFWSILAVLGVPFWLLIFWPVGVLFAFLAYFALKEWIKISVESRSGTVKKARCPSCERQIYFWTMSAFSCPYCQHMLMRNEESLYDITK